MRVFFFFVCVCAYICAFVFSLAAIERGKKKKKSVLLFMFNVRFLSQQMQNVCTALLWLERGY